MKMLSKSAFCSLLFLISFAGSICLGQSARIKQLEDEIFKGNNEQDYTGSLVLIEKFLAKKGISNDDRYYAYLNLSFTYKRLFDYPSVLKNLDRAMYFGNLTEKKDFYAANIKCQKALAYFDIQKYSKADSIMKELSADNYRYLDTEHQSKLIMQEGYLLYLKSAYRESDVKYDEAIDKLSKSSICDLPMIYGKKLELYGAMNRPDLLPGIYRLSMRSADSCTIEKYKMYTSEMMSAAYEKTGDFKNAFFYRKIFDSISERYNSKQHLENIIELETRFENDKKEHQIAIKNEKLKVSENRILILVVLLVASLLSISTYIFWLRQRKLVQERKTNLRFSKKLFEKIEDERKRIATDLHDSIGHELLSLKSMTESDSDEKIENILNDLRMISRNLHPALFEQVGFLLSLENLLERLQNQYELVITSEINYPGGLLFSAELQLYRIIQEALSNVIKYSGALAVKVLIEQQETELLVQIMDSGKGFDVKSIMASGKAFGLESILLRSKALNGEASIRSEEKLTIIEIKIPLK